MHFLDCHDLETGVIPLAGAIGVTVDELAHALRDRTDSWVKRPPEAPWKRMPREVLERFGTSVDDIRFEGAYYFHGTRALDHERFRSHGILPLDQMVEQIWPKLYDLVRNERGPGCQAPTGTA